MSNNSYPNLDNSKKKPNHTQNVLFICMAITCVIALTIATSFLIFLSIEYDSRKSKFSCTIKDIDIHTKNNLCLSYILINVTHEHFDHFTQYFYKERESTDFLDTSKYYQCGPESDWYDKIKDFTTIKSSKDGRCRDEKDCGINQCCSPFEWCGPIESHCGYSSKKRTYIPFDSCEFDVNNHSNNKVILNNANNNKKLNLSKNNRVYVDDY